MERTMRVWIWRSLWVVGFVAMIGPLAGSVAMAQMPDADCFSGGCGGSKGMPLCPKGYREVGLVLYANSKADAAESCETVVSCTNLGRKSVAISCRFYYGFNPIPPGGDRRDALCHSLTPVLAQGDTSECATDATAPPDFQAGGIFLAADADCSPFEGKGLVCAKGGDTDDILCQAHLVCGFGKTLEKIDVVRKKSSKGDDDDDDDNRHSHK